MTVKLLYGHVVLIRHHWLNQTMSDYKIYQNIKSDLFDLDAYNHNSDSDIFQSKAQMSERTYLDYTDFSVLQQYSIVWLSKFHHYDFYSTSAWTWMLLSLEYNTSHQLHGMHSAPTKHRIKRAAPVSIMSTITVIYPPPLSLLSVRVAVCLGFCINCTYARWFWLC